VFGDRRERRQIIKQIGIPFLRALWDLFPDRNLACAKPAIGGCERKQLGLWMKYALSGEHLLAGSLQSLRARDQMPANIACPDIR